MTQVRFCFQQMLQVDFMFILYEKTVRIIYGVNAWNKIQNKTCLWAYKRPPNR